MGGIDNEGRVYGQKLAFSTGLANSLSLNDTYGLKHVYIRCVLPSTVIQSIIQSRLAGTLMSYRRDSVTVR